MQLAKLPKWIYDYDFEEFLAVDRQVLEKQMWKQKWGPFPDFQQVPQSTSDAVAAALMGNDRFRDWRTSTTSSVLLVKGKMQAGNQGQKSVTSQAVVTWVLPKLLAEDSRARLLIFQCSEHIRSNNEYRGLAGMLRCVAAQLKDGAYSNNMDVMYPPNDTFSINDLDSSNVTDLCELLRIMTMNARNNDVTYLLVDGVTLAERHTSPEQLESFAQSLRRLLDFLNGDERPDWVTNRCALKVWLTNPNVNGPIVGAFPESVFDLSQITYKAEE